jgi:succinate dehydrogenase/fumarate reductase cytochrome b subunit
VILQKLLAKSPRLEARLELLELATGLMLFGFLQFHMFAVSSIILGVDAFNRDSARMDEYYLSYIGIPLIILALLVHGLVALRKAPWKIQEMRVFMQHSRRLAHLDTWAWGVQIVTAMIILVLAATHIWSPYPGRLLRELRPPDPGRRNPRHGGPLPYPGEVELDPPEKIHQLPGLRHHRHGRVGIPDPPGLLFP